MGADTRVIAAPPTDFNVGIDWNGYGIGNDEKVNEDPRAKVTKPVYVPPVYVTQKSVPINNGDVEERHKHAHHTCSHAAGTRKETSSAGRKHGTRKGTDSAVPFGSNAAYHELVDPGKQGESIKLD